MTRAHSLVVFAFGLVACAQSPSSDPVPAGRGGSGGGSGSGGTPGSGGTFGASGSGGTFGASGSGGTFGASGSDGASGNSGAAGDGGAAGGGGVAGSAGTGGASGSGGSSAVWRPFSDASPWNTKIAPGAAVDPDNAAMIADLESSSQWNFLGINIKTFSVPLYWANDSTPKVMVRADIGGAGFPGDDGMNAAALVPVPPGAAPDPEFDRHMLIVHEDRKLAWDFYGAEKSGNEWHCVLCATTDLLGTGARPIKEGNATWYTSHGSRACGLPLIAGLIRVEEIRAGRIEHALVFAYPHIRAGLYTPPASTAQVRIGNDSIKTRGIPCGGRIQLDPALDLDAIGLSASGKIVARALQEYGAFVGDYSGAINVYADGSPDAQAEWDQDLLEMYEVREQLPLNRFRVLELGTIYDDHNGD